MKNVLMIEGNGFHGDSAATDVMHEGFNILWAATVHEAIGHLERSDPEHEQHVPLNGVILNPNVPPDEGMPVLDRGSDTADRIMLAMEQHGLLGIVPVIYRPTGSPIKSRRMSEAIAKDHMVEINRSQYWLLSQTVRERFVR